MIIDGPLSISTIDDDSANKRTLEIRFQLDFQSLPLEQQVQGIESYVQKLYVEFKALQDVDANKPGVALLIQICEGLLPYIKAGEIDLAEVIAMDIDNSVRFEQSVPITSFSLN